MSKAALVSGSASLDVFLFNTADPAGHVRPGEPGFTLWPAKSAGKQFAGDEGGTQYFVSSNAVFDGVSGDSEELIVWALSNTSALDQRRSPLLTKTIVPSQLYAIPPPSPQKTGTIPYGEVFEGATLPGLIDTSDSRVLDVRYANGKLWAVLGTAADVQGIQRAGAAWFILEPSVNAGGASAKMVSLASWPWLTRAWLIRRWA